MKRQTRGREALRSSRHETFRRYDIVPEVVAYAR